MTTPDTTDRDLATFMAVARAVATEEAKHMPTTPAIERDAAALVMFTREQLAEARRAELAAQPSNVVSGAVRPSILAMVRDKVLARLNQVIAAEPSLQFAHRDFETASDDDLRSALEDALVVAGLPE
ncbi:MAG: hypothetical protein H0T46_22860 [Deltaproteobacteria bacterium]|nr:hypothetical protein [Deltaproteobacteria bacterium]